jgi:non-heme chloroperoxidase
MLSAKLVRKAELKVIPGAPHGMCTTHKDAINQALLAFIRGESGQAAIGHRNPN